MALIRCDNVTKGMRSSERTVAVKDARGRKEFLRVELDFLTQHGEEYWLPVGVLHEDSSHKAALIELPQESESGTNRFWAKLTDLRELEPSHA